MEGKGETSFVPHLGPNEPGECHIVNQSLPRMRYDIDVSQGNF